MASSLQIVLFLLVISFLVVIIYYLRKDKLTLQYSLIWVLTAVVLLFFIIFPNMLVVVSEWIGVETPSNFVFMLEGVFVLAILLSLATIVSKQRRQIVKLVQTISIIEKRLRELEKKNQ